MKKILISLLLIAPLMAHGQLWSGILKPTSGAGACTFGVIEAMYSSTGTIGADTYGSYENSSGSGTISITGNAGTSNSGEFGLTFWGTASATSTPAATGWSSRLNQTYIGTFSQASIGSGVTVTFSGTSFASGVAITGLMVTLHP